MSDAADDLTDAMLASRAAHDRGEDSALLTWTQIGTYQEARLGTERDGVTFSLMHMPTCYRRGPYRLLVEVCDGAAHQLWGCFDDQDQPMRWYHSQANAKDEAERIAQVLLTDRLKEGPLEGHP